MQNKIRESLRNICELLNRHDVEYLLIGGVAVGFHGFPRATADIDFWYNPTLQNFQKLLNALKTQGIDTRELDSIVFNPEKTFLRVPQLGFRTEFLSAIAGLKSYKECEKSAMNTVLDGVSVRILGYDDLIKNKLATKRPVDLNDVAELKKRELKK
jgi:hypothetical protein